MQLAHPHYLWLFMVYVPLIAWYIWKRRNAHPALEISTVSPFAGLPRSIKEYGLHGLFVLRLLTIGCLIIILARPQTHDNWRTSNTQGTDIVLSLDISSSMLARDFKPDRLGAAKEVATQFVSGRESDNIGLVIFAGESFTAVPMTLDRPTLTNYIASIETGMIEDGTAIGDGLATAINRIKDGKAKSKSIILLTDGSNNTGVVAPLTAAEIAAKYGIKVYTIGIGKNGMAPYPTQDIFGKISYVNQPVVIDEGTLKQIASVTGGKYFRATGNNVLKEIFQEIDQLEKTSMDVRHFSHTEDNYTLWAALALGLFSLEIILRRTWLRTIP
ncbi:MAG: VWA domain-containing protein [Bacteroidales bacterium]|nr:VWA domain-containing protein [Bacteroidales bacterium]MCD8394693.1 VWA domain-containing protein [Bacteroidales bacterium]